MSFRNQILTCVKIEQQILQPEKLSGKFVSMKLLQRFPLKKIFLFLTIISALLHPPFIDAQQPVATQPQYSTPYMLNLVPKKGGKSYSLYHKTKVTLKLSNQVVVKGKVRGVSKDSIAINEKTVAIADIDDISYNPGTALGVAAAIATTAGVGMIAFTADGGKDNTRDDTENAIFYTGIGLTVAGGIALIPTYFIKKHFTRNNYYFTTVQAAY